MPGIKDEREDSDGEEMEQESGESDKSTSTCESSDAPSDSDDSSEMDEEECERRRNECVENLVDLERQFTLLREQLYRERITQVDTKLKEVRAGRAQEWIQPLEELEENMRIRLEVATILREYRRCNIRNQFEAEELAAFQNYENPPCVGQYVNPGLLVEKLAAPENVTPSKYFSFKNMINGICLCLILKVILIVYLITKFT